VTVSIAFDAVGKRYLRQAREIVALDDVSFALDDGECLGVLGSARSGKSALLRLAAGLEAPDTGTVSYRGRDMATMTRKERELLLRHEIGCVWGSVSSNDRVDVVEFVAWPLLGAGTRYREATGRAQEMLRRVGGTESVGARLGELAASELTRISLAQALIRRPSLLLADEPSKTLDPIERDELLELLRAVAVEHRVTMIVTAGDATGVVGSSRIASLDRGRLRLRPRPSADVVPLNAKRRRPAGG
jgi:putative ABC transport system ATP-binding protein